ncbi:hypothetical protein Droror1_Dr00027328, partial [Drosera rotundifolia]
GDCFDILESWCCVRSEAGTQLFLVHCHDHKHLLESRSCNMTERHMFPYAPQFGVDVGRPVHSHLHPEPCVLLGGTPGFPHSNGDFKHHNFPEYHDGAAYHGMTQYPQPHPPTNLQLGVPGIPAGASFCNLHLNPASGSTFPVPPSSVDPLPSSSYYRANAVPMDDYAMEVMGSSYKRKNGEVIPGNTHYYNVRPSSSVPPMPGVPFDSGVPGMHAVPDYRSNGALPMSQDNGRNRAGALGFQRDSVWAHGYNHIVQGSSTGQPFQPPQTMWLETPPINSNGSGSAVAWNMTPVLPCFPGNNIHGGSIETANVGPQGYHEGAIHRAPANFLHSAPMINQPHNLHPAPLVQGIGRFSVIYQPPVAAVPGGQPLTNAVQHTSLSTVNAQAFPSASGFRMYDPYSRGTLPEEVPRHRNNPHPNFLPMDEAAVLQVSSVYEGNDEVDHHSDLRLDIDDMSYEELLSLGEQIGSVNTGLSEKDITDHLETKSYRPFSASINLEELPPSDQIGDSCVICQLEYEEQDKLGCLACGHDYHEECLKKWLCLKNVCPICKSTALAVARAAEG